MEENQMMTKSGNRERNHEDLSGVGFQLMALMFRVRSIIHPPKNRLNEIGIVPGMVVVDYGCGPGSYVKDASAMVGPDGQVYAADINPLAVQSVQNLMKKHRLTNVIPVKVDGYSSTIADNTADLIYALDMFHAIGETDTFLKELHRIVKPGGMLVIDDGHQPHEDAREKILHSGLWIIAGEGETWMRCTPVTTR